MLIARSKTDQKGRGAVRWLEAAAIEAGAFGSPLTPGEVPRVPKRLAAYAGFDPAGISGHSCHVAAHLQVGMNPAGIGPSGPWETLPCWLLWWSNLNLVFQKRHFPGVTRVQSRKRARNGTNVSWTLVTLFGNAGRRAGSGGA